jgi:heme/copper-type cytochrome/quinol oxidase subunit 3
MKSTFLPKTRAGKLSAALFVAFIALAAAGGLISSIQGNTVEYPNPLNSPLLGTVIYLMFSAAILASIAGLAAVKNNERSVLVYIAIPLGIIFFVVIVVFIVANLTGPHGG